MGADSACEAPQSHARKGTGELGVHAEGVHTSALVRGVSSSSSSEDAPCLFHDQSPKPVSSTLKSTKFGRELRREGDRRPAMLVVLRSSVAVRRPTPPQTRQMERLLWRACEGHPETDVRECSSWRVECSSLNSPKHFASTAPVQASKQRTARQPDSETARQRDSAIHPSFPSEQHFLSGTVNFPVSRGENLRQQGASSVGWTATERDGPGADAVCVHQATERSSVHTRALGPRRVLLASICLAHRSEKMGAATDRFGREFAHYSSSMASRPRVSGRDAVGRSIHLLHS